MYLDEVAPQQQGKSGSIIDALSKGATAYYQARSTRDLMKLNLARAKRGEQPVDAASVAPVVRVQHEVSAGSAGNQLATIARKAAPFAAAGLGLWLLSRFLRPRRR